MRLEQGKGDKTSKRVEAKINIDCSDELDKSAYLDKEGLPTKVGPNALTNVFV